MKEIANKSLTDIINWLNSNNLKINLTKTKFIQFLTYNSNPTKFDIIQKDVKIEEVKSTLFLGITIDQNLDWKSHIQKLCSKLDRFVFALYKLRQTSSKKTALLAYHGYVSSVLRYGVIIWGNSTLVTKAFTVQKRCIRAICGAEPTDTCKSLFKQNKILPLPCMYVYEMCIFVRKHPELFPKSKDVIKRSNRRDEEKLHIPYRRIQLCSNNCFCMAIEIYNKLPNSFKNMTLMSFKRNLFNFLLNKCYYSVQEYLNDKSM